MKSYSKNSGFPIFEATGDKVADLKNESREDRGRIWSQASTDIISMVLMTGLFATRPVVRAPGMSMCKL